MCVFIPVVDSPLTLPTMMIQTSRYTRTSVIASLLLLLAVTMMPVANSQQPQLQHPFDYPDERCGLECQNGGYCTFLYDTTSNDSVLQLQREIRSGRLVERCVCLPGFGGLGCELEVSACNLDTRTCFDNIPCVTDPLTHELKCDCNRADSVSDFAGRMCRKPYTEYCNGRLAMMSFNNNNGNNNDNNKDGGDSQHSSSTNGGSLTFCTNGGKCKSSYLSAQLLRAPLEGDTSKNYYGPPQQHMEEMEANYEHLGCVCNEAFYGPHCEFLNYQGQGPYHPSPGEFAETSNNNNVMPPPPSFVGLSSESNGNNTTGLAVTIGVFLVVLWSVTTLFVMNRRQRRQRQTEWINIFFSKPSQPDNHDAGNVTESVSLTMAGYGNNSDTTNINNKNKINNNKMAGNGVAGAVVVNSSSRFVLPGREDEES